VTEGLEITPTPSDAERRAIVEALERAISAERGGALGAWWAAGLPGADDDEAAGARSGDRAAA
jgi:hypothetical protein